MKNPARLSAEVLGWSVLIVTCWVWVEFLFLTPQDETPQPQEPTKTLNVTKHMIGNNHMVVYEFHMDDETRCIFLRSLQCDFGGAE